MDFTRQPILETVITPKEGYKLVIRSSKAVGQEEFFVDSVEVVSFGNAMFFRSLEKPKSFLVPTSDYEVLEVREARMVLKHVGVERAIKIGGGKEAAKPVKESLIEKQESLSAVTVTPGTREATLATPADAPVPEEQKTDSRFDKKRDRRRHYRRRRGREEETKDEWNEEEEGGERIALSPPRDAETEEPPPTAAGISTSILSSLLPPPPTLISETIAKYRENEKFKGVFFASGEAESEESSEEPKALDTIENEELLEPQEISTFSSEIPEEKQEEPEPPSSF